MAADGESRAIGAVLPWFSLEAAPPRRGTVDDRARNPAWWADAGCPDLGIPACLECPLPTCRYDLPPKRAGALMREQAAREIAAEGLTAAEVARRIGVSRRTVFRLKVYAGGTKAQPRPAPVRPAGFRDVARVCPDCSVAFGGHPARVRCAPCAEARRRAQKNARRQRQRAGERAIREGARP